MRREADILVATTIIESGLDIPNANTIFINQADNYGLADLHQLRGRVGRYKHRAYAYLLLDGDRQVTPTAARRLKAIEEFTELGAGFKIAMRDLEIRGAGNILGTQQSGHIAAVGYELYCQLLENAVRAAEEPAAADAAGGDRRSALAGLLAARLRAGPAAAHRGLPPAGARARPGPAGGFPPGAARPLRPAAGAGRVAAAAGGAAPAGGALAGGDGASGEASRRRGGPTDVVLGYRSTKRVRELAERSRGRLVVVDEKSAYFRLRPAEMAPLAMYRAIKGLLRILPQ